MAKLSLSFQDNGTKHQDLVFCLDQFELCCDSFYLAHDNTLLPEDLGPGKVRLVLVRLLEQWRDLVHGLAAGQATYLPYDFDDQATGWLHLSALNDDEVEVLPVWSTLEAWGFNPTSFVEVVDQVGETMPVWRDLSPQRMSRRELIEQIEASIAAARRAPTERPGTPAEER